MSILEKVLSRVNTLPSLPEAVARLSKAVRDPNSTATAIESIIRPDPALTTNLLKLANSAFFGFTKEITSVKQAVSLMGQNRVYELALSGAFSRVIPPHLNGYNISSRDFWLHSIAVGVLSEKIASKITRQLPEMIFTTGLLHDLGKIPIAAFIEKEDGLTTAFSDNQNLPAIEIEQKIMGTHHAEVGGVMAQTWNLPRLVELVILAHHSPNEVNNKADQQIVDIVHLADALAHMAGLGTNPWGLHLKVEPQTISRLNIGFDIIESILTESIEPIYSMASTISFHKNQKRTSLNS